MPNAFDQYNAYITPIDGGMVRFTRTASPGGTPTVNFNYNLVNFIPGVLASIQRNTVTTSTLSVYGLTTPIVFSKSFLNQTGFNNSTSSNLYDIYGASVLSVNSVAVIVNNAASQTVGVAIEVGQFN